MVDVYLPEKNRSVCAGCWNKKINQWNAYCKVAVEANKGYRENAKQLLTLANDKCPIVVDKLIK